MINQKKTAAILLGLTMGVSSSVLAAPAVDTANPDLAARIAAIEAQQQELTKQLSALKKENAKLKRTSKVAESNKNAIKGLKEVQNRFQLHGFGRVTWDNDNIKGYIDRNDNRRFYLDLKGKFKVNDNWDFNFESETNTRYASHVMADGSVKYHTGHDDEHGVIQRIWAEGKVGAVNFDVGRRWRGLGFQNVLLGNETDGAVISTPINKKGLKASAFYLTPTDKGYHISFAGVGLQGEIARGLQVSLAAVRSSVGRNDRMGINPYDTQTTTSFSNVKVTNGSFTTGYVGTTGEAQASIPDLAVTKDDTTGNVTNVAFTKNADGNAQIYYAGAPSLEGYNLNIDGATLTGDITTTTTNPDYRNTAGSFGYVLSAMWNPMKNIFLIGDYARSNAKDYSITEWGDDGAVTTNYDKHDNLALRLNYRWANIDNPGSFQLYARWYNYAKNINNLVGMFGDKEWGLMQPGSRGWVFGFKYVPAKNLEWETMFSVTTAQNTLYGHKNETYRRNFIRTQLDYHF